MIFRIIRDCPDKKITSIAVIYLGLGEYEKAIDWLETAYDERNTYLPYTRTLQEFDPIRDHPRFVALMKKMGL